jgi:hypothetical protein
MNTSTYHSIDKIDRDYDSLMYTISSSHTRECEPKCIVDLYNYLKVNRAKLQYILSSSDLRRVYLLILMDDTCIHVKNEETYKFINKLESLIINMKDISTGFDETQKFVNKIAPQP